MIWLIATARRTLVCFSSASRRPRSANTFPDPCTTKSLVLQFAISRLVILARGLEPVRNQFHVRLGRLHSPRRFLLEGMENIDGLAELHGIHRTIGISPVVLDDLENAGTFSLPRLSLRMLPAKLGHT